MGYKVAAATSDTLVYKLGLRNGDIIVKVNGQNLNSFADAANRLGDLYFHANTLSYALQIKRSGVTQNK